MINTERIEVRGYGSISQPATLPRRLAALALDLILIFGISLLLVHALNLVPTPSLPVGLVLLAVAGGYWVLPKITWGLSPGERLSNLAPEASSDRGFYGLNPPLSQGVATSSTRLFYSVTLLISLGFSGTVFESTVLSHPLWSTPDSWNLEPFVPTPSEWTVLPFFYSIAGWPKRFEDHPISYTLLYENGPPTRFVGHVIAQWDPPDVRLMIEGPKTPEGSRNRSAWKDCFSAASGFTCPSLRIAGLSRHLAEIRSVHPKNWELKWFTVQAQNIPPDELTQGIYLSGIGPRRIQDRFILINAKGIQQTLILDRPRNERGDRAFETLLKSIRSLRNFNELDSGRAWINQDLAEMKLSEIPPTAEALIQVQAKLISKISVDPGSFDSYFHLAGTASMLARSTHQKDGFSRAAFQNLQSAYKYSQDISPQDPRAIQIQNLWLEAQKH